MIRSKVRCDAVRNNAPKSHNPESAGSNPIPPCTTYTPNHTYSQELACPKCSGSRIWKAGFTSKGGQLFLCRDCLRRFQIKPDVASRVLKSSGPVEQLPDGMASSTSPAYNRDRRVGVTQLTGAKNLASDIEQRTQTQKTAQDKTEQMVKGDIVGFTFYQSKRGLDDKTVYGRARNVELLHRVGANLADPQSVLAVLAINKTWKPGTKRNLFQAYKAFARWKKIDLSNIETPRYRRSAELPYLCTESQLDELVAGSGWKTGAFLKLLKETGARTVEAANLQWTDIDWQNRVITTRKPAKNGTPRQIRVSEKCIAMLNRQPHNSEYVFGKDPERIRKTMRANFHWARGYIAAKTANKDLLKIHLHTFRHHFATKLYRQTGDLRYVQKKMGHRSITSTEIYEHCDATGQVEQYTLKAVSSKEEAVKLGELGFEPFDEIDGVKLYRRRLVDW